jgi:hypothetical protein
MSEEAQRYWEEEYLKWEYDQYRNSTDCPWSFEDWLKLHEVKEDEKDV